jgi:CRISPR-associated protein Cas2
MPEKNFYLVAYDIPSDKRRTKLFKLLENYGSGVQYSVFECLLTLESYKEMKKRIMKIIKPTIDHVRFYPLCNTCRKKIETTAGKEVTAQKNVIIV